MNQPEFMNIKFIQIKVWAMYETMNYEGCFISVLNPALPTLA